MKTRALAHLVCLIFLPLGADAESGMGKRGLEELSLQYLNSVHTEIQRSVFIKADWRF